MRRRLLLVSLLLAVSPRLTEAQDRGAAVRIKALDPAATTGRQVVAVIAINQYQHWTPLQQPVKDGEALRNVLEGRYAIDEVIPLYDGKATKVGIIRLLGDLQKRLRAEDSLLIFYAGHGHLDAMSGTGFWIPADGGTDELAQENWLPNSQIRGMVRNLPSKHVLVVSDSCFSGDLLDVFRGRSPEIRDHYFRKAYSLRARQVLTSGASESVPDRSEFAEQLILTLRENRKPYVDPVLLFAELRAGVKKTQPLLGSLQGTNHQEGASFLLFLKGDANPVDAPTPVPPAGGGDMEQLALTSWNAIKDSADSADFRRFMIDFPTSKLRGAAESRLRHMTTDATPTPPMPKPTASPEAADSSTYRLGVPDFKQEDYKTAGVKYARVRIKVSVTNLSNRSLTVTLEAPGGFFRSCLNRSSRFEFVRSAFATLVLPPLSARTADLLLEDLPRDPPDKCSGFKDLKVVEARFE